MIKHTIILGVRLYIINGRVTRKNFDDRSHRDYFMAYSATKGVILQWKPDQPLVIHISHHVWFDEYNHRLSIEDKQIQVLYSFENILKVIFIIKTSST